MVEHLDALSFHNAFCKGEVCHVRSSKGAVDGEEAQSCGRNLVEMGIGMCHQFIGLLRCCIQAYRMVHLIGGGVGNLAVQSIYRGGGSIDQVLDLMVPAGFQDIEKTNQIRLQISIRIVDAVPHSGLSGKVDDIINRMRLENIVQLFLVGEIGLVEIEVVAGQLPQSFLLETHLVVIIQVVKPDDRASLFQ